MWRTWHPRTRPEAGGTGPEARWTRLEILGATTAVVEFQARYDHGGMLDERSLFEQRAGRWYYVEGTVRSAQRLANYL